MLTYDDILAEADHHNLTTKEKPLRAHKGLIAGRNIAIKAGLTERDKKCVLAEELGHYYTGTGDITDMRSMANRKQEHHGRVYAYDKLVGLTGILDAYRHHCQGLSEAAEYLEVTEEFLAESLSYYKSKYGISVTVDNYVIYFELTIAVLELTD